MAELADYARKIGGVWTLLNGAFQIGDLQFPHNWLDLASPEDRDHWNIREILPPDSPPVGHVVLPGPPSIIDHNGSPKYLIASELPSVETRRGQMIGAVDALRDQKQQTDFEHDFGEIDAVDDLGATIAAGVRQLQMRKVAPNDDQQNWAVLQGQALAAVIAGAPEQIMPMRAEDNWNIQTTAAQVLQVTALMVARNSGYLFQGGAIKSQIRAAQTHEDLDVIDIEAWDA